MTRGLAVVDLTSEELATIDVGVARDAAVVAAGYGYVVGEVADPTPEQHAKLIALSRRLGRFLDGVEVRSVLCVEVGS
jgi:hypothetical protein